jgi:putative heme transporter
LEFGLALRRVKRGDESPRRVRKEIIESTVRKRFLPLPPALRHVLRVLLFFLVAHYLLLPQLGGIRASLSVVAHLNPLLVLTAIGAAGLSLCAYAQMARVLLPGAGRPSFFNILRVQLATLGASHVLPGGSAATTPLAYRLLRRHGVSGPDAGFVLAAQPIVSAAVLNALLLIALLVSIPLRGANRAYLGTSVVGVLIVAVLLLIVTGVYRGSTRADRAVRSLARRLRVDPEHASAFLRELAARIRQLTTDRRLMARAAGWAALQWIADGASLWIFLSAVGVRAAPDGLLVAFGLANISAFIPLTPGGVGVYEAVLTASLVGFGVPRAPAIVGVLAYRLVEFWLPIPVGIAAYLSSEASDRDEQATAVDTPSEPAASVSLERAGVPASTTPTQPLTSSGRAPWTH